MPGVKFVHHDGKPILLMDFVAIADYSVLTNLVDESIRLVRAVNDRASVLALIDLSNTHVNPEVVSSLKRLSRNNGPYIKAIAFVGLTNPWSLLLSALLRARRKRNHRLMRERSQALDWLVRQ